MRRILLTLILLLFAAPASAQPVFNFPDVPTANQIVTGPNGQQFKWDTVKWIAMGGAQPYDVGGTLTGKPAASQVVLRYPAPRAITFPSGLTGSQGVVGTAPAAAAAFNIQKNGTNVGTMNFAASAAKATFTMATATSLAVGDVLTLVAPATQDTALSDLGFSLAGSR